MEYIFFLFKFINVYSSGWFGLVEFGVLWWVHFGCAGLHAVCLFFAQVNFISFVGVFGLHTTRRTHKRETNVTFHFYRLLTCNQVVKVVTANNANVPSSVLSSHQRNGCNF